MRTHIQAGNHLCSNEKKHEIFLQHLNKVLFWLDGEAASKPYVLMIILIRCRIFGTSAASRLPN